MGRNDGNVVGNTLILDSGPAFLRYNIVIASEGYQQMELNLFQTHAQSLVDYLFSQAPFDAYRQAINVYRVDVASTDSGADDPLTCGDDSTGAGTTPRTFFDASFCNGGLRRLLNVDDDLVREVVAEQVPSYHAILVIVNSTIFGGSGGTVATMSLAADANEIGLHELGHSAFSLADEYCEAGGERDNYGWWEASEDNISINRNRFLIKWAGHINGGTAVPTTINPDQTNCDLQASPVPAGTIGAFEGAARYRSGVFRPEFNCRMRTLGQPFCRVCQDRIRAVLNKHRLFT